METFCQQWDKSSPYSEYSLCFIDVKNVEKGQHYHFQTPGQCSPFIHFSRKTRWTVTPTGRFAGKKISAVTENRCRLSRINPINLTFSIPGLNVTYFVEYHNQMDWPWSLMMNPNDSDNPWNFFLPSSSSSHISTCWKYLGQYNTKKKIFSLTTAV